MPPAARRPLTLGERALLLVECIPFLFLLAGTIFVLTIWSELTQRLTGERAPLAFGAVMAVVLLITGWIAIQRVRDVLAGSAAIAEDDLKRVWRPRRGARRRSRYGAFERLGNLRMSAPDFTRIGTALNVAQLPEPGGDGPHSATLPCRVTYSPASKIAWSVEQV